jgi:general secretion pathway protein E
LSEADLERDPRLALLGLETGETVCEPKGCERCSGVGFRGRVGVFEAVDVEGETREHVRAGIDSHAIEAAALRAGMTTMTVDAAEKVRAGLTSVAEALRVTAIR